MGPEVKACLENLARKILTISPTLLTVMTIVLVIGFPLGGISFATRDPRPSIQGAAISPDGSTCSITFLDSGNADVRLSQIVLAVPGASNSVPFPSSFVLHSNQSTTYSCALGSSTQFLPAMNGNPGTAFNLTARFDNGKILSYGSHFAAT